jgi:hypothetical protein
MYLTYQVTSGQEDVGYVCPAGQPGQLHVGPFHLAQWYGGGIEVDVHHGMGGECIVSRPVVVGVEGERYHGHQIVASEFPALAPYSGMVFGSVIFHNGDALCFNGSESEPVVDLR